MPRHLPEAGLTWYRGSVRPYASLWHTLIRLGELNRLSLAQLPDRPANSQGRRAVRSNWYPLFNEANQIDTNKISIALGESPVCMRWSHLGPAPLWFRSHFTNHLRFCQTCLSQGYHSSLYSLKLLDTCPIHGEPFFDGCKCGKVIGNKLMSSDFRQFTRCECGATTFIDPENCRRPKITIEQTSALDGIVSWLEELSSVIKPVPYKTPIVIDVVTPGNLDVASWCDVFGIRYPEKLIKTISVHHSLSTTRGGPFHDIKSKPEKGTYRKFDKYWWHDTPATWAYRSICRHLRRHCANEDPRLGRRYSMPYDYGPEFRKNMQDPKFAAAYTEAEWVKYLELNAPRRRWPYRSPSIDPCQSFAGILRLFGEPGWLDHQNVASSVRTWLEYHWATYCMQAIWVYYNRRTERIVTAGNKWRLGEQLPLPIWDWAAKLQPDGSVLFACVEVSPPLLPIRRRKTKTVRTEEQQIKELSRAKTVQDACNGPCLTWNQRDGWTATTAIPPDGLRFRRHKLLGSFKQRPKFWLFQVGGVYIARMETVPLQVVEQSPREVISLLRIAYAQYERTFLTATDRVPNNNPT